MPALGNKTFGAVTKSATPDYSAECTQRTNRQAVFISAGEKVPQKRAGDGPHQWREPRKDSRQESHSPSTC